MSRLPGLLGSWAQGPGPLYQRLARAVAGAIARGELAPGTRLPPERLLARELSVSRSTTAAAYELLREQGLVVRRQGSGTRVAGTPPASPSARLDAAPVNDVFRSILDPSPAVIDFAAAILPALPLVADELAAITPGELAEVVATSGYFPAGLPALRQRIAEHCSAAGVPTTAGEVLVTTGAQQAISLVASLFVRPGDAVITEDPTYVGALDAFRAAGARLHGLPVGPHGVDPDQLDHLVGRVRPALVYLVTTHQNPTGAVLSPARRRAVVEVAHRHRLPVVEDLVTSRLHLEPMPLLPWLAHHDDQGRVITVDSLGKDLWAGLRLGWVRAPTPLVTRLARAKATADLSSPLTTQLAGVRLLDRLPEAATQRSGQLRAGYEALTARLSAHLPGWTWDRPRGGPVLWVRLPEGSARDLLPVALRHGVNLATGPALSPSESHDDRLRLPLVTAPGLLDPVVERLAAAWAAYRPGRPAEALGTPLV
jgi:DNA-binding transcriptional MocR family regulator